VEIRTLIRDISLANPLWGAPRIHGELLKLGIAIGQTTVAKYMARNRRPPFQLLYGLLILKHGRREILCLAAISIPNGVPSIARH
jgi:hypothetical protein